MFVLIMLCPIDFIVITSYWWKDGVVTVSDYIFISIGILFEAHRNMKRIM